MSISLPTIHVAKNIVSPDSIAGLVQFSTLDNVTCLSLDLHYNGVSVRRSVKYDCKEEICLIYDFNVFFLLNSLFNSVVKYQFICHGILKWTHWIWEWSAFWHGEQHSTIALWLWYSRVQRCALSSMDNEMCVFAQWRQDYSERRDLSQCQIRFFFWKHETTWGHAWCSPNIKESYAGCISKWLEVLCPGLAYHPCLL